jgi:GT2 family glycosyltransferase
LKLLLALPNGGRPTQPFLSALAKLTLPPEVTDFDRYVVSGNFIPAQRELAVRRALAVQADFLAMIDDDMTFAPDALTTLCDALVLDPSLAVVGALYYSRDGIRPMAASRWSSADTTGGSVPGFTDRIVPVDAVGFGCVLLRTSVLRALARPYFATQIYIEEGAARVRVCNEDYLFCERIRRAGFGVALHAGVRCGHFDRDRGVVEPVRWESPAETAHERMLVAQPGPRYALVPFDENGPRAHERHERAVLDYVIVD